MEPGQRGPAGAATPAAPPGGASPSATPIAWGSLAILERLGEDHFGDILLAHDPALGREVTLRLRPADPAGEDVREARFLDEAKRFASVHHPNVLVVHGADRRDGWLGVWSDPVAGETLEDRLLREGPLPASEVRRVGLDLCHALTAIHAAGIIHREVRTSGVVREEGGRIVLMDSGALGDLSRRDDENRMAGIADPLALALAPEQLLGLGVNLSTDVYGLGLLLYRLASGRYPVEVESVLELAEHHSRRLFEPLRDRRPGLPLDFVRVIEKAIDPEPAQRYPNAVAFERALASTLMAPVSAPEPAPAPALPDAPGGDVLPAWLVRWRSAIGSTAALAFGCLVAVMLMAEPSPSRIAPPAASEPATPPLPDGPPAPAAWLHRPRPRPTPPPAAPEPEEQWAYKPIPSTSPYGPPTQRAARPTATPVRRPSGAVAGATAMLRALAQGPPMQSEAAAESFGVLTLSTVPDEAAVSIDGVLQHELTNGSYRLEPGQHSVLVERRGYQAQQLPPIRIVAGQKLRASMTLAPEPLDSLGTP